MQDSPTVFLKRVIGIVIILAILLGLVLYFSRPKTAEEATRTPNEASYQQEEGTALPLPSGEENSDSESGIALSSSQSARSSNTVAPRTTSASKPKAASPSDILIRKAEAIPASVGSIVYYDSTGFNPANFVVRAGTTVRFINRSDKSMRVVSVIQAGAPVYPELDQVRSVGRGGYYDFNFSKRGSFTFKNGNFNHHFGSVIVQ